MNKLYTLIILLSAIIYGQSSSAIKVGYFSPKGGDGGLIIGYENAFITNEVLSFGWSFDWYHDKYTDKEYVNFLNENDPFGGEVNELRAKTNTNIFPVMANLTGYIPVGRDNYAFVKGSMGFEVLFISYTNYYSPNTNEDKILATMNYRFTAGFGHYLGRNSEIFAEVGYHSSTPSWEYEIDQNGRKRTYERELDMSGMMARIGFLFYY